MAGALTTRTASGKQVAFVVHRSQWQGERDSHQVVIAGSPLELLEALEGDVVDLAKEVLTEAGIDAAETIK